MTNIFCQFPPLQITFQSSIGHVTDRNLINGILEFNLFILLTEHSYIKIIIYLDFLTHISIQLLYLFKRPTLGLPKPMVPWALLPVIRADMNVKLSIIRIHMKLIRTHTHTHLYNCETSI